MAKYKLLLLISVIQQAAGFSSCISHPRVARPNANYACPEGQSLLSMQDINEMIDYVARNMNTEETIINSYHAVLANISNKFLAEIEEFHEQLEHRPDHIQHILEDMENKRRHLASVVSMVADKIKDFDGHNQQLRVVADRSDKLLDRFGMYKEICQMNCGETEFDKTYARNQYKASAHTYPDCHTTCWKIGELRNKIKKRLNDFMVETIEEIYILMEDIDEESGHFIQLYKDELKNAAIKRFGTIMYDILSLQDEYYHYSQFINNLNEYLDSDNINRNISEIVLKLVALENEVDAYGVHCLNCYKDIRNKRDIHEINIYDYDNKFEIVTVDDLINIKIEKIRHTIAENLTNSLRDVDDFFTHLNTYENPDVHVERILPIDKVAYDVQKEKEAFDALKSAVPLHSLNKILELTHKSEDLLIRLDEAKEYMDSVKAF